MHKSKVFEYLDSHELSQKELADKLGISQPAISKWPELIPELQAIKIERLTGGELVYDESLYGNTNVAA